MSYPPAFYEESVPDPLGAIQVKVFVDHNTSTVHLYAAQAGDTECYSSRLSSLVASHVSAKKTQALCYLAAPASFNAVASAVLGYLNRRVI